VIPVKLRASGRAVPRNEPFGRLPTEYHAALSINREDLGAQVVVPDIFGAASKRAARAGGHKEVINLPVKGGRDLVHRGPIVRLGIGQVGILVGPETVLDGV